MSEKDLAIEVSSPQGTDSHTITSRERAPLRTIFGIACLQFALTYIERVSQDVVPLFISQFTTSAFLTYLVWSLNPLFNIINQP